MLDVGLISAVKKVFAEKPRHHCSVADVIAVIQKESGGVATFRGSDPLFRMNLNMVLNWSKHRAPSLTEQRFRQTITIPDGPLRTMWCKFRFEAVYVEWARPYARSAQLTDEQMILLSSSVGLGQQMLRFVVQHLPATEGLALAYKFMGDTNEQIRWVIGNLEQNHHADKKLQFARYNGGPGVRINGKVYSTYGADVLARSEKIAQELRERGYVKEDTD
jgi:hypothetical protein